MSGFTTTAGNFCAPSAARPAYRAASLGGAVAYSLTVRTTAVAKHAQKRFTMAGTDIDGWPLGPRDGTSG
jgi:hypothetical protein